MRFFHAPPVGAVINRRGPGGRMGRRPAASGFSAPAGGRFHGECAAPGGREKIALARSGTFVPPRCTGVGGSVPAPILPDLRAR